MPKSDSIFPWDKKRHGEAGQRVSQLEDQVTRLNSALEELTVLNDLAIAASTSLEVDKMLDIIVEKSIKALKAEQGEIVLVTDLEDEPLKTLIRQADRESRTMTYKIGMNITGWVLKHLRPLLIDDLASDKRFQVTEQQAKEIKSVLCVPILVKGRVIGILTVVNKKGPDVFSNNDLRLLTIISSQSAQLIRNSELQADALEKRRLEHEMSMARDIQLRLLPETIPKIPRLDIATYFNPADQVGGDYFDYFTLNDQMTGIVIADVSGHGPSSALVMTMVKGVLHAVTQDFQSAERIMTETNGILAETLPKQMFVTMMFLVFDTEEMSLCFSNAGHNPMIHYKGESQSSQLIELKAPALGLSPLSVYSQQEIPLEHDDLFLVYTDGITEAFNDQGEMFSEKRLTDATEEGQSSEAAEIIERVKSQLMEFTGQKTQNDDVAMIAVRIE